MLWISLHTHLKILSKLCHALINNVVGPVESVVTFPWTAVTCWWQLRHTAVVGIYSCRGQTSGSAQWMSWKSTLVQLDNTEELLRKLFCNILRFDRFFWLETSIIFLIDEILPLYSQYKEVELETVKNCLTMVRKLGWCLIQFLMYATILLLPISQNG